MDYIFLKNIHQTCVLLTFFSFSVRFFWMLRESPYLQAGATRFLPHLIDTALLLSAVGLSSMLHQYPFTNNWLTAKIVGLLVYILAGTMAIKRGKTKAGRIGAGLLAYAAFAYIIAVAFSKNPLVFI